MKTLFKHLAGFTASSVLLAILFGLDGIGHALASGQIPLIGASFALSGVVATLLTLTVLAPVATIAAYLTEQRLSLHWMMEPVALLGLLLAYATLPLLLICRGYLFPTAIMLSVLFPPALTYYLVLRALGLREHL